MTRRRRRQRLNPVESSPPFGEASAPICPSFTACARSRIAIWGHSTRQHADIATACDIASSQGAVSLVCGAPRKASAITGERRSDRFAVTMPPIISN